MKTAVGSCLLNSLHIDQINVLEEVFATLTESGWQIPNWLKMLRKESQ